MPQAVKKRERGVMYYRSTDSEGVNDVSCIILVVPPNVSTTVQIP